MHLGIITSGNENLLLCKLLNELGHTYTIWYDSLFWPYDDKPFDVILERTQLGIQFLETQNVDAIIVHPIVELQGTMNTVNGKLLLENRILPLFQTYLLTSCFPYSLVGKIGLVGTHSDITQAQSLLSEVAKKHTLTEHQKNIAKFQIPFSYRCKEVPMRNYFLRLLSPKNYLINNVVKHDCQYFKDANIDTLIPLQYSYFAFETGLHHYLNPKKMRFHGQSILKETLKNITFNHSLQENVDYKTKNPSLQERNLGGGCVSVFVTGSDHLLTGQKKMMRMIGLGTEREIKIYK